MFQASETLSFREHEVLIRRRPYKRTLGITLQLSGRIQVSAPRMVSRVDIEKFLSLHLEWIENHLARYKTLRERYPRKFYREGEEFLLLGSRRSLRFTCGLVAKPVVSLTDEAIVLTIPQKNWSGFDPYAPHPEYAALIRKFFSDFGQRLLSGRLEHYSNRMGLKPSAISFRSQKTRWGSCSARGRISLNWRLIIAPLEVIDYVVVHELSHLRHYNHSERFWQLVATEIQDFRERRAWLREHQYEADFLAKRSELHGIA